MRDEKHMSVYVGVTHVLRLLLLAVEIGRVLSALRSASSSAAVNGTSKSSATLQPPQHAVLKHARQLRCATVCSNVGQ